MKAKIRAILLRDWDPIRVQEFPEPYRRAASDEYDACVAPVIELLLARKSSDDVADYLYQTETRRMGSRCDRTSAVAAAEKLTNLEREEPPGEPRSD